MKPEGIYPPSARHSPFRSSEAPPCTGGPTRWWQRLAAYYRQPLRENPWVNNPLGKIVLGATTLFLILSAVAVVFCVLAFFCHVAGFVWLVVAPPSEPDVPTVPLGAFAICVASLGLMAFHKIGSDMLKP